MSFKLLKKTVSIFTLITFLATNNIVYAAPSSKSLFKNKKVDYDKLSSQQEDTLNKKKSIIQGEDAKQAESQKKEAKKILSSHLTDISQIHIPQELGRVVEVYQVPEDMGQKTERPLIVHIQDLHTNPEAELNLAKILEILLKDYNMGLICSEGAVGKVDTSSVSSFPDSKIREKVSRIFIDSGELTGEEYLSITKYPALPIWGIEDKDIYFKNILDFNRIMKFNPSSQVFISQTKKAIELLKPKIYSKDLLELDNKESEFSSQKLDTAQYIKYLLDFASMINSHGRSKNISSDILFERGAEGAESRTAKYKNIFLLKETMEKEKAIDQLKIMKDSQNILLNLQSIFSSKALNNDSDTLIARANLFKDQKISPFSFYSYLKDLALKHIKEDFSTKYSELNSFIDYLTKVNSLDSTKLFTELEDLNFEIKQNLSKTSEQKTLIKASRNINFLENFFNLKVSNEDLDYYLNNKPDHKVSFFKAFLQETLEKYNINSFIDYNPDLIDNHLHDMEEFYKVVKERDVAMVTNSLSEIENRSSQVSTLIAGGFHTKGITKLLREKSYSYIVVSPYSKTDIDEENYHFLLQGRRKPITELLKQLDLSKIIDNLLSYQQNTLRVTLMFDDALAKAHDKDLAPKLAKELGVDTEAVKLGNMKQRMEEVLTAALIEAGKLELLTKWKNSPVIEIAASMLPGQKVVTAILRLTFETGDHAYFKLTKNPDQGIDIAKAEESEFSEDTDRLIAKLSNIAVRTADIGVVRKLQHMVINEFLEKVEARSEQYSSSKWEKEFGLQGIVHIQLIPKTKEMQRITGVRGHYGIRRDPKTGYWYIYIDKGALEGKTREQQWLVIAEEVYEFMRMMQLGFSRYTKSIKISRKQELTEFISIKPGAANQKKEELKALVKAFRKIVVTKQYYRNNAIKEALISLVEYLNKGIPAEVYATIKRVHNDAPKSDEGEAFPDLFALEKFKPLAELFYQLGKIGGDAEGEKIVINLTTGAITWNSIYNKGKVQVKNSKGIVRNYSVVQALFDDIIDSARLNAVIFENLKYSNEDESWLFYIPTKTRKLTKDDMASALLNAAGWNRPERGAGAAAGGIEAELPISARALNGLQALARKSSFTITNRQIANFKYTVANQSLVAGLEPDLASLFERMRKLGIENITIQEGQDAGEVLAEALAPSTPQSGGADVQDSRNTQIKALKAARESL